MKKNNFVTISHLGLSGSFSHQASMFYFGKKNHFLSSDNIAQVCQNVKQKKADFAVLPLENSLTGSINESYDALIKNRLSIVGELILRIRHHLMAKTGLRLISRCYSHAQSFLQCAKFFSNSKHIEQVAVTDTAKAAKIVKEDNNPNISACAPHLAAKLYHLKIIKTDIQDNHQNYTRFAVLSGSKLTSGNKISIAFSIKHVPGSLYRALKPFADRFINLTKIESRPVFGSPWEYLFLMDFDVTDKDYEVQAALSDMKKEISNLTILGRYQKGKTYES